MKFLMALSLTFTALLAHGQTPTIEDKQFPDEGRVYRPGVDTGFGQYLARSLYGTKKVVLTFDDGPDPIKTPRLLDILKKYNVKATFFMLSEKFTPRNMPLIKRVVQEGHAIASHHHDHLNNNTKAEEIYRQGLRESIIRVAQVLEEVDARDREIYYRFPYGAYGSKALSYHHFNVMKEVSQELFGDNCINFAFWDIDSLDWVAPMEPSDIISTIVAHVVGGTAYRIGKNKWTGSPKKESYTISRPIGGGVVLMHDIHNKSIDTVEELIKTLIKKRIEVVPLNEVAEYSYKGKECRLKQL